MINVNLLPQDFREREKTPIRIFAATIAASALVAGLGGAFAYMQLGMLASEEQSLARLTEDRQGLEPQLKHHSALGTEIAEKEKWQQAIKDLRNGRVVWSRKLDQMIDLVSQAGDQGRYLIWFTDLAITQTVDGKLSGGGLVAKGLSNGDDVGKVALFVGDLRRHEFARGFSGASEPEGKVSDGNNSNVVEFPLALTIAPKETKKVEPKKTDAPADPKAAAPANPQQKPEAGK